MTKRTIFGFLIASSLIFNIGFIGMWITHAVPRHFTKHRQCGLGGCDKKSALQKTLSLSDSQWTLLKPRIESYRQTTSGMCREIAKNRAALVDELEKTPTDTLALSACKERIAAGQKNMQTLIVNHILDEKNCMTQDQRLRFFKTLRSNMSCAGFPGAPGMEPGGCGK